MGIAARLGDRRVAVSAITAVTAFYFLLVAFDNITDFGTNQQFVKHVLAMDTTFKDPDVMWRRITSPTVANMAYISVIVWESLTAFVLIAALARWIRELANRAVPGTARRLSTLGWTMAIILFGGGFIVIGGEWFQMWQSKTWNGLQPAFQNVVISAVGLILANLPERDADRDVAKGPSIPGAG